MARAGSSDGRRTAAPTRRFSLYLSGDNGAMGDSSEKSSWDAGKRACASTDPLDYEGSTRGRPWLQLEQRDIREGRRLRDPRHRALSLLQLLLRITHYLVPGRLESRSDASGIDECGIGASPQKTIEP